MKLIEIQKIINRNNFGNKCLIDTDWNRNTGGLYAINKFNSTVLIELSESNLFLYFLFYQEQCIIRY